MERCAYLCIILCLLFLPVSVSALSLADFPAPFVVGGVYDQTNTFVVGGLAPSSDTLAVVDISTRLQFEGQDNSQIRTMLDEEVVDPAIYNLIVIGHPCDNTLVEILFGLSCQDWQYSENTAIIKLVPNGDRVALLVAGTTNIDTRKAAKALADYESHSFDGTEAIIGAKEDVWDVTVSSDTGSIPNVELKTTPPVEPPPQICGDGICQERIGEDCESCSPDCGMCPKNETIPEVPEAGGEQTTQEKDGEIIPTVSEGKGEEHLQEIKEGKPLQPLFSNKLIYGTIIAVLIIITLIIILILRKKPQTETSPPPKEEEYS